MHRRAARFARRRLATDRLGRGRGHRDRRGRRRVEAGDEGEVDTETRIPWHGPPLRIALLTDIHAAAGDGARVAAIVDRTLELAPDLVLLGGDFVEGVDAEPEKLAALAPLARLRAPRGVLAVLGNHDTEERIGDPTRRDAIVRAIDAAGIRLLENEHVVLDDDVTVVGMGSWRAEDTDARGAFAAVDEHAPVLVLVHKFQSLRAPHVGRFDLALAGHTHAGQACIPFTSVCPWLEADMKPFRHGLYDWPDGGRLYVSAGLGMSGARLRIGARPEIALLELRRI